MNPGEIHYAINVGVQAERTLLAWRRTALSLAALAALAVKTTIASLTVTLLVAAVLVAFGAGFVWVHERRLRRRAGVPLVSEAPVLPSVLLLTTGCVLVALLAVIGTLA
jgi:uncharacterized membrane protein YidH (DUF202 family)